MGIKIGMTGVGAFGEGFVPVFKAHPMVDELVIADLDHERLQRAADTYQIKRTFRSHAELIASDVDAVAIFTQKHLHAPMAIAALDAGKHVYSAVPIAQSLDDIRKIVDKVESTGLIYMMGETSYYYPCVLYCRKRFKAGDFGDFVYGEGQYLHDMDHGLYESFQNSGGDEWKKYAGLPPMYYPTHSFSTVLSVTGARATHVSCLGYVDKHEDGIFKPGANFWDNTFSNETALVRTSDGGICRFNEFHRVGWHGKAASVYMSMFGTKGSYEETANNKVWAPHNPDGMEDVTEQLACREHVSPETFSALPEEQRESFFQGVSALHPTERLPKELAGIKNTHSGSHLFLVDDFVKAVATNKLPPNHVWASAKYCAPGLVAHESALQNGEMMEVPDFGEPPAAWEDLYPEG